MAQERTSSRIAHFLTQNNCHPRVMSRSLPHLTLTTSTSSLSPTSPIVPTFSPSHPSPSAHDPYLPCQDPRQRGGSTQIPSLTNCESKGIEHEDLEPRRIELDMTDPNQTQESIMRSFFTEDMDGFGKIGVEMSYVQSQMHSDYDRVLSSSSLTSRLLGCVKSSLSSQCHVSHVAAFVTEHFYTISLTYLNYLPTFFSLTVLSFGTGSRNPARFTAEWWIF